MAMLSSSFLSLSPTLPSSSVSLPSSFPIRLQSITLGVHSTLGQSFQISTPIVVHKRGVIITKASADPVELAAAAGDGESTTEQEKIGIQDLPLESKLQLKLEQKLKMKLAKKLRLRRARLMRKRALRKKGRWPPSKMNKLKNV